MTSKRQTIVHPPPGLARLLRVVNLLPKSIRCPKAGIHELSMRSWYSDGEQDVTRDWFYFWRHIDPLPVQLQAFVLHDQLGAFIVTEQGMVPIFDPHDFQPLSNIEFPDYPAIGLKDIVSKARERIDVEINKFEDARKVQSNKGILGGSRPLEWRQYQIKGSTFGEVGADLLYKRARQRFFFLLVADQILNALTMPDPQSTLNNLWYEEECALSSHLFVADDEVQIEPPALFSLLIGIQVSRIHKCGICENYFWAGRKDKLVCSLRCGATKRKRQERERYIAVKIGARRRRKRKDLPKSQPHRLQSHDKLEGT